MKTLNCNIPDKSSATPVYDEYNNIVAYLDKNSKHVLCDVSQVNNTFSSSDKSRNKSRDDLSSIRGSFEQKIGGNSYISSNYKLFDIIVLCVIVACIIVVICIFFFAVKSKIYTYFNPNVDVDSKK